MATLDTQSAVLDAARHLFAEKGYPATSLREITREAGVNLAAVNYHFGSKEGLLIALVRQCLDPINEERLRRLDAAEATANGEPIALESLLRIFLEPVFESMAANQNPEMPCLLARMHHEPHPHLHQMLPEILGPVIAHFLSAVKRVLPEASENLISIRGQFMVGAMLHILDMQQTMNGVSVEDRGALLEELIAFTAAGFRAAPGA